MQIGSKKFDIGSRTFIVGILNVTPDSFFDGGLYDNLERAVRRAAKLVRDGADIIEIGGESSRPGFVPVPAEVETGRILPVLRALKDALGVPVAVDTYKPEVAEAALQNGASLINDVMCFKNAALAKVCASHKAVCCCMHNRDKAVYDDFLPDVIADIKKGVNTLIEAGVDRGGIIIDPGIGFAKTAAHNFEIMRNLSLFRELQYPVMLGASRKSFIGAALNLPAKDRLEGTLAVTALAIGQKCDFIRVHDVLENKRAAIISDEIVRG